MSNVNIQTRQRVLMAMIEVAYAQDPLPTAALNSMLMSNLSISPMEMTLVERANVKAWLGKNPSVVAATWSTVSFDIEMAGSGTAGTPPAFGPLLRGCALSETILAAAVTGTATAGGTSSITLAVPASAADGAYNGMTMRISAGTGAGESGVVASYVGATKLATMSAPWKTPPDVTSIYSIDPQVLYKPISDTYESVALYCYVGKVLHKLLGSRGTVSLKLTAQGIPTFSFKYTGLFVPVTDAGSVPKPVLSAFQAPLAVNNQNTTGLIIAGYSASVVSEMSFDLANAVTYRSLPGGTENVAMTDRQATGSITQEATLVADHDWWAQIKNVTLGQFSVTHGTVAGNKVKIDSPSMQISKPAYADKDGVTMLATTADFIPVLGNDELTLAFL